MNDFLRKYNFIRSVDGQDSADDFRHDYNSFKERLVNAGVGRGKFLTNAALSLTENDHYDPRIFGTVARFEGMAKSYSDVANYLGRLVRGIDDYKTFIENVKEFKKTNKEYLANYYDRKKEEDERNFFYLWNEPIIT